MQDSIANRTQQEMTKAVCIERATHQPRIHRANTSMTKATYTNPCHVATYVKSVTVI